MRLLGTITLTCAVALATSACSNDEMIGDPVCDRPLTYVKSPGQALEGSGWHRVYIQGASATPDQDGRFGMTENRGEVVSRDHFLLSAGTLAEWIYPLRSPLEGHVFLHIARVDDPEVVARYELALVRDGSETELVTVDDEADGVMGYAPYERCFRANTPGSVRAGDSLLLRVTNLTGGMLGVVTQTPDYFTWVDVAAR